MAPKLMIILIILAVSWILNRFNSRKLDNGMQDIAIYGGNSSSLIHLQTSVFCVTTTRAVHVSGLALESNSFLGSRSAISLRGAVCVDLLKALS